MPVRIPIYQERLNPEGFGVVPQARAVPVSDAIGQGMQVLGASAVNAGAQIEQAERRQRLEFDTLRAEDAYNRLRESQVSLTMDPEKGFLARRGSAAIAPDVVPSYTTSFQKAAEDIEAGLANDQQRQMFRRRAAFAQSEFRNALSRHVLDQSNAYANNVYEGTLAVETQNATRDWQNPYTIDMSMGRIEGAVSREAQRLGLAPDASEALLRNARSKVHSGVLAAALEANNVAYAQAYLKHNASQLNTEDLLKYQGLITKEYDAQVAIGTATDVVKRFATAAQPNDFDRLASLANAQPPATGKPAAPNYGNRPDGTPKGNGWLGPIKMKSGDVMTELTIGVNINGKETDIPTIVPTLTKAEIAYLAEGNKPTEAIVNKAVAHAKSRIENGNSPYADEPGALGGFSQLAALVEKRESAGKQFDKNGKPLESPKGAIGVMQVMPATGKEAAALAGLPWDEQRFRNDPDYNRRLGQAYLAKQLKDFDGDVAKAVAAYNAGPGRVQDAIKRANRSIELNKNDPSVPVLQWTQLIPQETRDYLAAIMPKYSSGQSAIEKPTLQQVHDAVRAAIGSDNPQRLKSAIDEATRQWNDINNAQKQRDEEAVSEAYRVLESNGGKYDALPTSLKSRIPPEKFSSLRDYAEKVSGGQQVKTDWTVYYPLRTDMDLLAKTNLGALKGTLADTDFKELVRLQQEYKAKPPEVQTQVQTIGQRMSMRLLESGIDPTPKPGAGDATKVAQVYSLLDQNIRVAETSLGRKLKPDELDREVDRLFTQVPVKGVLFGTSDRRAFELQPSDQIVVPTTDRNQIVSALQAAKQPVTEERILYYFKKAKGLQ